MFLIVKCLTVVFGFLACVLFVVFVSRVKSVCDVSPLLFLSVECLSTVSVVSVHS